MSGRCPQCGGSDLAVEAYDFGRCSQTGYYDAGERWRCRTCGASGDVEEIDGETETGKDATQVG